MTDTKKILLKDKKNSEDFTLKSYKKYGIIILKRYVQIDILL